MTKNLRTTLLAGLLVVAAPFALVLFLESPIAAQFPNPMNLFFGAVPTATGNGVAGTNTQRVVVASDNTAIPVSISSGGSAVDTDDRNVATGTSNVAETIAVLYGYDGTSNVGIRSKTSTPGSSESGVVTRPFSPTDGTNVMPTMDAAARMGFVAPTAATTGGTSTCFLSSAATTNSTNCSGAAGTVYTLRATNTTTTNYFLRMYNLASAPTCSSSTGFIETIPILGAAANGGGIASPNGAAGQAYSTGIGFCLTGGGGPTDNTNAATGVYLTILYK